MEILHEWHHYGCHNYRPHIPQSVAGTQRVPREHRYVLAWCLGLSQCSASGVCARPVTNTISNFKNSNTLFISSNSNHSECRGFENMHKTQELYCLLPCFPDSLFLLTRILNAYQCLQAGNTAAPQPEPWSSQLPVPPRQRHPKRRPVLPERQRECFQVWEGAIPRSS